jgi:hypothetical protein
MKKPAAKKHDSFLKAATRYLEQNGWSVLVIGGTSVHQGDRPFNFKLMVGFTGKKKDKSK